MTSKIRIKMGDVEVEYEGSEEFLRQELKELLSGVLELHRERKDSVPSNNGGSGSDEGVESSGGFNGTTNTVAAKLSVTSGPDLIIAAVARLTLVAGKDTCTRGALLKEMQSATSYYKKTYSNNLSTYLKRLVGDDRLREISKHAFSLSAPELQKIKGILAS